MLLSPLPPPLPNSSLLGVKLFKNINYGDLKSLGKALYVWLKTTPNASSYYLFILQYWILNSGPTP
jgi:hypothetical protein